ncbi:MAG: RsmD family RNA methyltransferase [Gemmataceae bacterium]|nr:RsmD family RNA methyltransferase [Gemmataceae bacterium]MDW8267423.1 RsmD family RNA methyltransferase [Gemmataceae bacterium]
MHIEVRIVAGKLRGRKVRCRASPGLRPTPQMVREALFSILGDAVPGRPFVDVFAGTGAAGLEALSRGASTALFVERDFRLAENIERHLQTFAVNDTGQVVRADVYRWAERWEPPAEPVNVFIGPPFADFERQWDRLRDLLARFQARLAVGSVLILQGEHHKVKAADLPAAAAWEERHYGRNLLLLWVKTAVESPAQVVERP